MTEPGASAGRIGLFGGTFDPPHVGHVAVAADVADALALNRVLWIPAGEPPHKGGDAITSSALRLEMVREAAKADPRFEVSTLELERQGPSYAVDTVRALRAECPDADLFLIVGADQLAVFDKWRDPEVIVEHVRLAMMDREGESAVAAARGLPGAADAVSVPVRRMDVSSSEVRACAREGRDISNLVPAGVAAIIKRERLYSAA